MTHGLPAISYASVDRPDEGLVHVETALRLRPHDPIGYLFFAGQALSVCVRRFFRGGRIR
jgi:hypothetical protein